jgi:hypothetical protein
MSILSTVPNRAKAQGRKKVMLALGKAALMMMFAVLVLVACDGGVQDQARQQEQKEQPAKPAADEVKQQDTPPPAQLPPPLPNQIVPFESLLKVDAIDLLVLQKDPLALEIRVKGTASTAGWTQVYLNHASPPMVDMGEVGFTLAGLRPKEPVAQVLTPVEVTFILDPLPPDAKVVRIFSQTNEMSADIKRDPGQPVSLPELIYTVDVIDLALLEKMPLALEVRAKGTARTGGWDEPYLRRAETSEPGVLTLYYLAMRPTGPATMALAPLEATPFKLDPLPDEMKKVKVIAETNEMTVDIKR